MGNSTELVAGILNSAGVSLKYTDAVVMFLTVIGLLASSVTSVWWMSSGTMMFCKVVRFFCYSPQSKPVELKESKVVCSELVRQILNELCNSEDLEVREEHAYAVPTNVLITPSLEFMVPVDTSRLVYLIRLRDKNNHTNIVTDLTEEENEVITHAVRSRVSYVQDKEREMRRDEVVFRLSPRSRIYREDNLI